MSPVTRAGQIAGKTDARRPNSHEWAVAVNRDAAAHEGRLSGEYIAAYREAFAAETYKRLQEIP
jgi:hypothetical protein